MPCASYSRQIFKNITLVLIKALRMLTNYQRESERENWNLPFSRVFDMSLINRWRKNEEALPEWIISVLNQGESKQINKAPADSLPYSGSGSVRSGWGHWRRWWRGRSWWGWRSALSGCTCSKRRGEGDPPCHSLPWVTSEKQQSRPGSTELPISCRFYVLDRQEQGGGREGEKMSPSSPINAGVRSQQTRGQPSLSPS